MNKDTLKAAENSAKQFLILARNVKIKDYGGFKSLQTGKTTAAVKRASMYLSRALSEMRKPG